MNKFYTYAFLREDGTPFYIGKGSGRRIYENKGRPCGRPKDISRVIFLKQNLTEEEAFRHEIYMIAVFGRKDLGTGILYNRTDGGDGTSGLVVSEKTKIKISEANKGKNKPPRSKEHRRKLCEVNLGKLLSEETKRKISEKKKGKTLPEEVKAKLREANKGKILSEETRKKLSESAKNRKPPSEETRKKISEASKGRNKPPFSEEHRKKISEAFKGRKWWNDGCGNSALVVECPGENWVLGRGKAL